MKETKQYLETLLCLPKVNIRILAQKEVVTL